MSTKPSSTLVCLTFAGLVACGDGSKEDGEASTETSASEDDTGETTGTGTEAGDTDTTDTDTDTDTDTTETGDPLTCWTDLSFGEREVVYEGFSGGSEGVSFGAADGLLYVTSNHKVWQLDADFQASEFSAIPDALGLAATSDEGFLVASIGEFTEADGAIYRVDARGVATSLATGIDSPNFVTITPDGSALVSDDFDTRVFRVTLDGEVEVAIADVPSPNGMAYSPDGAAFYVASTFTPDGQLTRYDVGPDGLPVDGSGVEILHLGMGSTPDGIAVDADDMVYVAANLPGEIWRVDGSSDSLVPGELVTGDLGFPASLAFGRGPGFDPCSLYVTQLQGDQLQRVFVGVPGAALY